MTASRKWTRTVACLALLTAFGCSAAKVETTDARPLTQPAKKPAATRPATAPASQPSFEKDILAYEAADKKQPPTQGAIVFYGSSSIRLWKTLKEDFPDLDVINRGFGGSSAPDAIRYVDRVVTPYKPRAVVIYEGDNDLAKGRTPEQFLADCQTLAKLIHAKLPETRVLFLAIKPSVKRLNLMETQKKANGLVEAWVKESNDPRLEYIDVVTPMLDEDGKPKPELFVADMLHMKPESYKLWVKVLEPRLKQ